MVFPKKEKKELSKKEKLEKINMLINSLENLRMPELRVKIDTLKANQDQLVSEEPDFFAALTRIIYQEIFTPILLFQILARPDSKTLANFLKEEMDDIKPESEVKPGSKPTL